MIVARGRGLISLLQQQSARTSCVLLGSSNVALVPSRDVGSMVGKRKSKKRVPTMEIAASMPLSCTEMDNTSLFTLASTGHTEARGEMLKRHIMTVDKCSYEDARIKFLEIVKINRQGMWALSLPYKIGVGIAVTGAAGSLPMVFDLNTALVFNEGWVTTDVPEPRDLETALEVGSWTWNWMEPPLGTASFALLCLQYARAQLQNLGIKPYTDKITELRAKSLANRFPQYDQNIVMAFSESVTMYDDKHGIPFK